MNDQVWPSGPESEIVDFVRRYNAVRNNHDAEGMACSFTESADLIGANGVISNGREAIRSTFENEHSSVYRDSHARRRISSIRLLRHDIAIVNGSFEVDAVRSSTTDNELETKCGLFTLVLERNEFGWMIASYRSMMPTNVFEDRQSVP
jgi:uncharacterized protein (TIGR02246 family)